MEARLFMGGYVVLTCRILLFFFLLGNFQLPYFSSLHMLTGALLPRAMWTGEVRRIALKDVNLFITAS